jgi:hypothetical protein
VLWPDKRHDFILEQSKEGFEGRLGFISGSDSDVIEACSYIAFGVDLVAWKSFHNGSDQRKRILCKLDLWVESPIANHDSSVVDAASLGCLVGNEEDRG